MIVGTGLNKVQLDDAIITKLRNLGIKFDILDTFQAVSTFNSCNEDNYNVLAFLLPGGEFDPQDNSILNDKDGEVMSGMDMNNETGKWSPNT